MSALRRRDVLRTLALLPWAPHVRAAPLRWRGSGATEPGPGLVADFDRVSVMWLSHGFGHEALTSGLVKVLQPHVRLAFFVADDTAAALARALSATSRIIVEPQSTFFLRDAAVLTRHADRGLGVVDLRASQYGATAWCAHRYWPGSDRDGCVAHAQAIAADRDGLDRALAQHLGATVHTSDLALEGGGVEVNGRGLMIANAALLRSRNPALSQGEIERKLLQLPGIVKTVWLAEGLAEDVLLRGTITGPYVAWGAGGHTDEFVRFADERTVLLAWPDDADVQSHPVSRLTRERMQRNLAVLAAATDVRGRRLRVIKVPMPRILQRPVVLSPDADRDRSEEWRADYFPARESRRDGQTLWQVATASYLNFVVANGVVVLPDYEPHGTPPDHQERVGRVFTAAFPGRRIEFVDPISANWVGGGLHCATLHQP